MSQQQTLPVTLPPALCQEPLKPVSPPTDTHQEEQVKEPTPLPVPCQKVPSGIPGEVPLVHGEKHTTPVKGVPEQDCEPQEQEQHLEQQQQQQQEQHKDHQDAGSLEQQLEEEKTQREQPLKGQLQEDKKLLDQQLDRELTKGGEQLENKETQLLEPLAQQEEKLDPPEFVPAPGQVQETHPAQPLKGEVLPPAEQQQQKQEVQWPPKHK
ncbi:PREDICTED: involucrin [Hipposideros armiger]|uniref:Involucrin n=1 Tax=Hipposideros armiger TaxID=186990 RepID=A0A8B7Q278_HIPAR|nr:PREDICTED: involucrin [Hipposideros armiger]